MSTFEWKSSACCCLVAWALKRRKGRARPVPVAVSARATHRPRGYRRYRPLGAWHEGHEVTHARGGRTAVAASARQCRESARVIGVPSSSSSRKWGYHVVFRGVSPLICSPPSLSTHCHSRWLPGLHKDKNCAYLKYTPPLSLSQSISKRCPRGNANGGDYAG